MFVKKERAGAIERRVTGRWRTLAGVGLVVAALSTSVAMPANAAPVPSCSTPWSSAATYKGGEKASQNGHQYVANWWTQSSPATSSGAPHSGKPWLDLGLCQGSAPTATAPTAPAPTATAPAAPAPVAKPAAPGTPAASASEWQAGRTYVGGDRVTRDGVQYVAGWWTRGDDPKKTAGAAGSGAVWTVASAATPAAPAPATPATPAPPTKPTAPTKPSAPTTATKPSAPTTAAPTAPAATGTAPATIFGPYKDVTINLDWNTNELRTAIGGSTRSVVDAYKASGLKTITLGFATGSCGSETWGGIPGSDFATRNVPALDAAGIGYIVSTGGAAGAFHCDSGAKLREFIKRYASPHLLGIDFDIEAGQSAGDITALVQAASEASSTYPGLRFSFTLATLAAGDGSHGGLNSTGDVTVKAITASGLKNYTINLMTMDYGTGAGVCVMSGAVCDMGQSAIQAAKNLTHTYGIPAGKIELTPMIGVNDVVSNVFSIKDAEVVARYAKDNGLAGVHYWSLDRDTPCANQNASATCSSMPGVTAGSYGSAFAGILK